MTATTFIHTSDFQLGMTRWFLKGEAQGRFNDDREAAIVGRVTNEQHEIRGRQLNGALGFF